MSGYIPKRPSAFDLLQPLSRLDTVKSYKELLKDALEFEYHVEDPESGMVEPVTQEFAVNGTIYFTVIGNETLMVNREKISGTPQKQIRRYAQPEDITLRLTEFPETFQFTGITKVILF